MATTSKNELYIVRKFNAPRSLVFEAFTQTEHLANWWGPEGCTIEVIDLKAQKDGRFHYAMKFADGNEMCGLFQFKEVTNPEKIVFTNSFADRAGNVIAAPMPYPFPKEILNTFTFEETDGVTTMVLKSTPVTQNTVETTGFVNLTDDMYVGYNRTFDMLTHYIRSKFQLRRELKTENASRVSTYLNFPGNTEEAFNFYKKVFGGEFNGGKMQRFGDIPPVEGQPPMSESDKKLILHVELPILAGHVLMATDAPESMGFKVIQGNNMHINLEPETRVETKRLFDALSEGGNIVMPLEDMFWGGYYGSFTDKYGINWMFNCREPK